MEIFVKDVIFLGYRNIFERKNIISCVPDLKNIISCVPDLKNIISCVPDLKNGESKNFFIIREQSLL